MRTVGIDYLSVGRYDADGATIHKILLEAGIWIIEGLDLSPVTAGRYEMICLPVKLHGSDGAPARVILRPAGGPGSGRAVPADAGAWYSPSGSIVPAPLITDQVKSG